MAEQLFSGLMVATALALLVRLALGERGRDRVAKAWRGATRRWARRSTPRAPDSREAARLADHAIRRARDTSAVRHGNVIRPSAFDKPTGDGDGDGADGARGRGRRDRKLH